MGYYYETGCQGCEGGCEQCCPADWQEYREFFEGEEDDDEDRSKP